MNATINFELRTNKENARGESPIYLRISYNRKNAWMSTGIKVPESNWNNDKQRVRRNHDRYKKLNHELEKIQLKAQDAKLELKDLGKLDAKRVINRVKGFQAENFFVYAEKYINHLYDVGSVRRAKNAKVIVNKVRSFEDGKGSLTLQEIDVDFLNGLEAHLKNEYDNAPNTIRKNFQRLRHLLETARKEKYIATNPFLDYDLPTYQKPKKTALSIEQIKKLEELDLKRGSSLWHARNYFMFSFYNAGIRFGDLCLLKRKNIRDGRLKYLMSKTRNNSEPKYKNIKLLPQAIAILEAYDFLQMSPEHYLFPIVDTDKNLEDPQVFDREKQSRNAIQNRRLKKLAKKAEITENLTTHIARHSFANFARKSGMNIYAISKALAHSDLKTTETYLDSFDEEMLDNEMDELFN